MSRKHDQKQTNIQQDPRQQRAAPQPTPAPRMHASAVVLRRGAARDVLTGAPLEAGTLRLVVHDYDSTRPINQRKPVPTSINRRQIDDGQPHERADSDGRRHGAYLGGMSYSPAFATYIAKQLPHSIAASDPRLSCWQWYANDYVRKGVVRAFTQRERDYVLVHAVLRYRTGEESMADVAASIGRSPAWLAAGERRIVRYVRAQYGMPGDVGPDVQEWHASDASGPLETGEAAG